MRRPADARLRREALLTARILAVDDVYANVRLLEARLAAEYYDVKSTCRSSEVMGLAVEWQPDAILLDIMMPDIDGIQLCRQLKAEPATAHIPVIMVTALREMPDRLLALASGADEFLTKPVAHGILLARLRSVLRLKSLLDEWRARGANATALGLATPHTEARGGDVLIIDDLDARARRMRDALHQTGVTVTIVDGENTAQSAIAAHAFDLLTINMSPMAGDPLRTIAKLRAADTTRDTPMLLVAEADQTGLLIAGLDLGANDCLMLPFDEAELRLRARNHISRKQYQDRLRVDVGHAMALAVTDPLTGLPNRRHLDTHLDRLDAAGGLGMSMILMIDIDHFKSINDRYGHAAGDAILTEVGQILSANLRASDLIARYGGEEFVVVAPLSAGEQPDQLAERLRDAVEKHTTGPRGENLTLTISIGAALTAGGEGSAVILERADRALYAAKRGGRNRVVTLSAKSRGDSPISHGFADAWGA